jgi:hypothetical protein
VSTTGTIRNDDDRPTIIIDSPTVDEGNDPNTPTPIDLYGKALGEDV